MFDMIGRVGVGLGGVGDCWGEWRLEGEMGDTAAAWSMKYL